MPKWVAFGTSRPDQWQAWLPKLGALPWYGIHVDGQPHDIAVCLGEAEDGRLVCTGLLIDPRQNVGVTSRLLREIPLGEIVALASSPKARAIIARVPGAVPYRIRKPRPGPKGLPQKYYVDVAERYRRALRTHPRTPVRHLMAQMGISETTAHRYLQRCRDLGLLDSRTTKGKTS
jgi:hypothetical protein